MQQFMKAGDIVFACLHFDACNGGVGFPRKIRPLPKKRLLPRMSQPSGFAVARLRDWIGQVERQHRLKQIVGNNAKTRLTALHFSFKPARMANHQPPRSCLRRGREHH